MAPEPSASRTRSSNAVTTTLKCTQRTGSEALIKLAFDGLGAAVARLARCFTRLVRGAHCACKPRGPRVWWGAPWQCVPFQWGAHSQPTLYSVTSGRKTHSLSPCTH